MSIAMLDYRSVILVKNLTNRFQDLLKARNRFGVGAFLSPNVGGHQQPFQKVTFFTIPKRSPAESPGRWFHMLFNLHPDPWGNDPI